MRILLFGKNGQIGWELQRTLASLGEVMAVDTPEIDFLNLKALREFALEAKSDLIVNAAAYTDVDKAESEPEIAMTINGEAPSVLAEAAKKINAGLVHYSTDYVFDGTKGEPYTEDDEPNPINEYGRSKLAGDLAIQASGCAYLILRSSWIYGARGENFFLTIQRLAQEKEIIRVVDDQIGSPTWSRAIAESTASIIAKAHPFEEMGLLNYAAKGSTNWYGFAKAILKYILEGGSNIEAEILAIPSSEFQSVAARPAYSVFNLEKISRELDMIPSSWREQLEACWQESVRVGMEGETTA